MRRLHKIRLNADSRLHNTFPKKEVMKLLISSIIDEEIQNSLFAMENAAEFIQRVHLQLMEEFNHLQNYAPLEISGEIKEEIISAVTEVYRAKTYGYYDLQSYKRSVYKKTA